MNTFHKQIENSFRDLKAAKSQNVSFNLGSNWRFVWRLNSLYYHMIFFFHSMLYYQVEKQIKWISFYRSLISRAYYFFYNVIKKDMLCENSTFNKAISFLKRPKLDILVRSCWLMEVNLVSFSKIMHRHFCLGEQ